MTLWERSDDSSRTSLHIGRIVRYRASGAPHFESDSTGPFRSAYVLGRAARAKVMEYINGVQFLVLGLYDGRFVRAPGLFAWVRRSTGSKRVVLTWN